MSLKPHVGLDDRRQSSVKDLIHQFDPSKAPKQPKPVTYQIRTSSLVLAAALVITAFALHTLLINGLDASACHNIWRPHIAKFGDKVPQWILDQCASKIQWLDWCDTQLYCKPLVRIVEWIG